MRHQACSRRRGSLAILTGAVLSVLAACGGSSHDDDPPATTRVLSGVVPDGPLAGAIACYDLSDNGVCDSGEPTATASDSDGRFSLTIAVAQAGQHGVVVDVPATAVDRDTGVAVGTAFRLRAPPTLPAATTVFVSPLTHLVVERAAQSGISVADAAAGIQAQLGLSSSPLSNFVTPADAQAARLARVVSTLIVEVGKLAAAAGATPEQARALVADVTLGNLSTLAAYGGSGTPAEAATTALAAVLTDRNLDATTAALQAQVAAAAAAPPPAAAASGPFISVRSFRYASASDYFVQAFVGNDGEADADGRFWANETRQTLVGGVPQPFNRNTAYWTGTAWKVCDRSWHTSQTRAATATTPQTSTYCEASKSEARDAREDVSGQLMADVVRRIRTFPLPDTTGLPINWGPEPTLLGDAVFPTGSVLTRRQHTSDVGNTDRYVLTDKPRVQPDFRHAPTLEALKGMSGNLVNAATTVSNQNTAFLGDVADATVSDPALQKLRRYRVAFHPTGDAARFFRCDARAADNVSLNCVAVSDGATAISVRGDARVLGITSGYPAQVVATSRYRRFWVERDGVVFSGYTDLQRSTWHQRLNTTAWVALRDRLGIPVPAEPTAPVANTPVDSFRTFSYTDADNYAYRRFTGPALDANGATLLDEQRYSVAAGSIVPFSFGSEFWTGADWYACPNDLRGVNALTTLPNGDLQSTYCRSYVSLLSPTTTVTLDGRNMAEVIRDIRWYPGRDGVASYGNYGPNPDSTPMLAAGVFPPGSTMSYQKLTQTREPEQVFLGASNVARVVPFEANLLPGQTPYVSFPPATTLEEMVAAYYGARASDGRISGNTTLNMGSTFLATPSDPLYTTEVGHRIALDANGQKARFYRHNRFASNNASTNYVAILDTTYVIETVGGRRVLRFAQTPPELLDALGFERIFVERDGEVRYGLKSRIWPEGQRSVRFNGVAADALIDQLGLGRP